MNRWGKGLLLTLGLAGSTQLPHTRFTSPTNYGTIEPIVVYFDEKSTAADKDSVIQGMRRAPELEPLVQIELKQVGTLRQPVPTDYDDALSLLETLMKKHRGRTVVLVKPNLYTEINHNKSPFINALLSRLGMEPDVTYRSILGVHFDRNAQVGLLLSYDPAEKCSAAYQISKLLVHEAGHDHFKHTFAATVQHQSSTYCTGTPAIYSPAQRAAIRLHPRNPLRKKYGLYQLDDVTLTNNDKLAIGFLNGGNTAFGKNKYSAARWYFEQGLKEATDSILREELTLALAETVYQEKEELGKLLARAWNMARAQPLVNPTEHINSQFFLALPYGDTADHAHRRQPKAVPGSDLRASNAGQHTGRVAHGPRQDADRNYAGSAAPLALPR